MNIIKSYIDEIISCFLFAVYLIIIILTIIAYKVVSKSDI